MRFQLDFLIFNSLDNQNKTKILNMQFPIEMSFGIRKLFNLTFKLTDNKNVCWGLITKVISFKFQIILLSLPQIKNIFTKLYTFFFFSVFYMLYEIIVLCEISLLFWYVMPHAKFIKWLKINSFAISIMVRTTTHTHFILWV